MKKYKVTEKQLEKLNLCLDELSGVHKDMMGDDGCVNLRDLEDAKKKLNETIRELKFLAEDIENQPLETRKEQKTLFEVVGRSVSPIATCPWFSKYSDAFRAAGYRQPNSQCPRSNTSGFLLSCEDCWRRPAEPMEDDHAR